MAAGSALLAPPPGTGRWAGVSSCPSVPSLRTPCKPPTSAQGLRGLLHPALWGVFGRERVRTSLCFTSVLYYESNKYFFGN